MMRTLTVLFVSASAALTALPQNPPSKNPVPAPAPAAQDPKPGTGLELGKGLRADAAQHEDGIFATWLLIGSNNAAQIAQIGQQRATDPEVKQLAQTIIDDHRRMSQRLQTFASAVGYTSRGGSSLGATDRPLGGDDKPLGGDKPVAGGTDKPLDRPAGARPEEAGFGRGVANLGDFDHVGILQELGDECLKSARAELESKQGAEFDQCFVGTVIGSHKGAKDMLAVFQRHAGPSLKPILAESSRTVEMHLEHAKDLAKSMHGKSDGPTRDSIGGK